MEKSGVRSGERSKLVKRGENWKGGKKLKEKGEYCLLLSC